MMPQALYQTFLGLDDDPQKPTSGIEPSFDAKVTVNAQLDILVTPKVRPRALAVSLSCVLDDGPDKMNS